MVVVRTYGTQSEILIETTGMSIRHVTLHCIVEQ